MPKLAAPTEAFYMFNMLVGDSVVVWRAWVIHQRMRWVVLIPCTMLLLSLIFCIIDLICLTTVGWNTQPSLAKGGVVCAHAELMSWAFSLATNATCTILIGYQAWQYRRSMRLLNIVENRRMSAAKLLLILVESGFVYCLFWLTQLITLINIGTDRRKPIIYVYELLDSMGDQIPGMYPTLIIVIVNLQQTIWDTQNTAGVVSNLQFSGQTRPTVITLSQQRDSDIHLDSMGEVESREGIRRHHIKTSASQDT
ncbi:hypothetical protein B0H19DRAFT_1316442 [Mycena capillaripes]|nr:hypothetical protein B0H19DRAFT_1316442 [Mycena capillaripes]